MDTLRGVHRESCEAEGMSEAEIERDWAGFVADYDAWLADRAAGLDAFGAEGSDAGRDDGPEDLAA